MYTKYSSIPLKGSSSAAPNNLSILNQDKSTTFCVVGKNSVHLTFYQDEKHINLKQLVPKANKDVATEGQIMISIIEAKFVRLADRNLLVILTTKGIFFYEDDGGNLVYFHPLNIKPIPPEDTTYARGVVGLPPNMIGVGTSYGVILLFEVPMKGNNIVLKNEINDKHFQSGIAVLASDERGNFMCASDTCGDRLVDITAHARWIYSLDVCQDLLVSTGEDCCFRIWQLNDVNRKLKINHLHSEKIIDTFITSAQFNHGTEEICVSSFDNLEVLVYKQQ